MPAIVPVGILDFTHSYGALWKELPAGGVLRLINKTGARHRGWITLEPPPGSVPVRTGVNEFMKHLGDRIEDARNGTVFEIYDGVHRVTRGYLTWEPPPGLDAAGWDLVIPYWARTRSGRRVQREMFTRSGQFEPPPRRRRAVLASA